MLRIFPSLDLSMFDIGAAERVILAAEERPDNNTAGPLPYVGVRYATLEDRESKLESQDMNRLLHKSLTSCTVRWPYRPLAGLHDQVSMLPIVMDEALASFLGIATQNSAPLR